MLINHTQDFFDRPAIVCQAPRELLLRCYCPTCIRLDAQFPHQGYQLSLIRWIELGLQA